MTLFVFANNAASTLAGAITNTALALNLSPGGGALFPSPGAGQGFAITAIDAATGLLKEIMLCTARSGDTLTVVRAQEGTTALSWNAGDLIQELWTAGQCAAMLQQGQVNATRIVTASGAFTLTASDNYVGLNRTVSPAVSSASLPSSPTAGQAVTIEDLAGNFNAFPVTISPPGGMTIAGLPAAAVLNVNRQSTTFRYYGSNVWSIDL